MTLKTMVNCVLLLTLLPTLIVSDGSPRDRLPHPSDKVPRPLRRKLYRVESSLGNGRSSPAPGSVSQWLSSYRDLIDQWGTADKLGASRNVFVSTPDRIDQGPVSYIIGHRGAQGPRPTAQMEPEQAEVNIQCWVTQNVSCIHFYLAAQYFLGWPSSRMGKT